MDKDNDDYINEMAKIILGGKDPLPEPEPEIILSQSDYCYQKIFGRDYKLYKDCSLDEFGVMGKQCINLMKEMQGIYIFGGVGVGKTSLALACIKWWLKRSPLVHAAIRTMPEILDILRRCIKDERLDLNQTLTNYIMIPLLVIDDFGVQKSTEWGEEKTFELIDGRWKNRDKRLTIVTSNYTPTEIMERSCNQTVTDRILSRILGMCVSMQLEGCDRRTGKG